MRTSHNGLRIEESVDAKVVDNVFRLLTLGGSEVIDYLGDIALEDGLPVSEILGRRGSHDKIATLSSLFVLGICHGPVMATGFESANGSRCSIEIPSVKYLRKSLRVIDQNHVWCDADNMPVFGEEIICCEGQLALPSLPAHPERTESWKPRS